MSRINILDENTANKIAAGEVVERPASVIKELIENSIDAQSKDITIEIEEGGQQLIRIIDNGEGIHPEDIERAFLSHATSKIEGIEDIFKIKTLGFRGEALASIAAVSRVILKSRVKEFDFGKEVSYTGGHLDYIKDVGANIGTTIEVFDLFYNVPARRKFLKSTQREAGLISEIVSKIAIANSKIAFKLFNNSKRVINTFSSPDTLNVIRDLFNKETCDDLIEIESHGDTMSVYGYIGNENLSRGSRNNQNIYINGRYIKSKLITAACEKAFKSFITINKFPFFIIFIDIYPELIDVNVHPAKTEVKFNDDREIFKMVFDSVHKALRNFLEGSFVIEEEKSFGEGSSYEEREKPHEKMAYQLPIDFKKEVSGTYLSEEEKGIEHKELEMTQATYIREESLSKLPALKILGQFNSTYIIAEAKEELFLIDQHAAHEKVLFEKYMGEIENNVVISQILLIPKIIELSLENFYIYKENEDIYKRTGFNIEVFGENTVNIREVPIILGKPNLISLFQDILDDLKNMGRGKTTDIIYGNIARKACRAAVKAMDALSLSEMDSLIIDLGNLRDPFTCPHGRPTIIKLTLNEIEKRFKRI
ncbi:MAG TPA: DNA mismatch repair endonuclease MutL [Clostridiaceae bacterium]